jgi:hypothetical protein
MRLGAGSRLFAAVATNVLKTDGECATDRDDYDDGDDNDADVVKSPLFPNELSPFPPNRPGRQRTVAVQSFD